MMTATTLKTISEVAAEVGVPFYRIQYAHKVGKLLIPETRWRNQRVYTSEDVQRVKDYFKRQDDK